MRTTIVFFVLFFSAFLVACEDRSWAEDIQTRVNTYNQTAQEESDYTIESGSSVIFVTEYAQKEGLKKMLARHLRDDFLNFERHIYTENGEIRYTHYIGVAPNLGGDESSNFVVFNEQTFWKDNGVGLKLNQQLTTEDFVQKEEALKLLSQAEINEKELSKTDYDKIDKYLNELVSSKPKK